MTKSKKSAQPAPENKGFLKLAGEALSVLGSDIVEGKEKVVEAASEKITVFKQAVGKIIHREKPGKPAKKKAAAKTAKKVAKAPVKKAAKKKQPARRVKKVAPAARASKAVAVSKKKVKKTAKAKK